MRDVAWDELKPLQFVLDRHHMRRDDSNCKAWSLILHQTIKLCTIEPGMSVVHELSTLTNQQCHFHESASQLETAENCRQSTNEDEVSTLQWVQHAATIHFGPKKEECCQLWASEPRQMSHGSHEKKVLQQDIVVDFGKTLYFNSDLYIIMESAG